MKKQHGKTLKDLRVTLKQKKKSLDSIKKSRRQAFEALREHSAAGQGNSDGDGCHRHRNRASESAMNEREEKDKRADRCKAAHRADEETDD